MKLPINILGIGSYLPKNVVTNDDLSRIMDTSDEWIYSRTGIKSRRKIDQELTHEMAYAASLEAIKEAKISKDEIDLIIVATISENQKTPSVANFVAGLLGITHECMTFDINAACSGFVYGLEVAASLLQQPKFKKALVIGAETMSKILDYSDRKTAILFGDGAGAVVIEKGHREAFGYFYNSSKADMHHILDVSNTLQMDGPKVYLFAVDIVEKSIREILKQSYMTIEDIDIIIPHQANARIISAVAKNMGLDESKFVVDIETYGNTSAASIPITLKNYKNQHKEAKKAILVGFGGGFTWGAAIVKV